MILIALGANLPSRFGAPEDTLVAALKALENAGVQILQCSRIWITEPVPKSDQPDFRNAVAQVQSELSARALLDLLHRIEADFGRVRSVQNAPRLLDLDLIAYHDEIVLEAEQGGMIIPHPRMHQRRFVLAPLCDIAPDWVHPSFGRCAEDLLDDAPDDGDIYPQIAGAA